MSASPLRAAIYARVSRDEQVKGYSIPMQQDANRKHCEANGYTIVAEFAEDFSGTAIHRPEMDKLLTLVFDRRIDVVVVYVTDRLTRGGPAHLGWFLTTFADNGVTLERAGKEQDDSPEAGLFMSIEAYAAQKYMISTLEATGRGLRARVASGKPIGAAQAPFGLKYVPPIIGTDGKPVKGTLNVAYEVDPHTVQYLHWMFDQLDIGVSLRQIGFGLEAQGVLPPYHRRTGSTKWSPRTTKGILQNRCYLGEGVAFRVKVTKEINAKGEPCLKAVPRQVAERGEDDPEKARRLPDGVYPKLIDPALFERVQVRLARNAIDTRDSSVRPDRNPEVGLLRRGIVRCPVCKNEMMVNPGSRGGPQYRCDQKSRRKYDCPGTAIRGAALDAEVWTSIQALRKDPRGAAALVERLRTKPGDDGRAAAMLASTEKQLAATDAALHRGAARLLTVDDDLEPLVRRELRELKTKRDGLAELREQFANEADAAERKRQQTERAIATIEGAPNDLSTLSYAERRDVLKHLGATVWLYPADAEFRWYMTLGFGETVADSVDGSLRVWSKSDGVRVSSGADLPLPPGFTGDPFASENVAGKPARNRFPG